MTTVTVAITTHNRAEAIGEALDALKRQTDDAFQIIVCDNGSTDHTAEVLARRTRDFADFIAIRDARPGQLVGWHRCLETATGEVIA